MYSVKMILQGILELVMMVLWECSVGQIIDNDSVNRWCHMCCL